MKCKAIKGFLARQWYNESYCRGRLTCHLWKGYTKGEKNLETKHKISHTECCLPQLKWCFFLGGGGPITRWSEGASQNEEFHIQESLGSGRASKGGQEEIFKKRKGSVMVVEAWHVKLEGKEWWKTIIVSHLRPRLVFRNVWTVLLF